MGRGEEMQKIIVGLIVFLLIGGFVAGLNFAYEAELDREDLYLAEPEEFQLQRALYEESHKEPRYPDFSNAEQVPDGVWDCIDSSYGGDQYWTGSGDHIRFACDALGNTYAEACEEIGYNTPGTDDDCINRID